MVEATSSCSTDLILPSVLDDAPYQSSAVVELSVSDGFEIDCRAWAFDLSTRQPETVVFYRARWAAVAVVLNSFRLLFCCASAAFPAFSTPGGKPHSVNATVSRARCCENSSSIRDTRPSARTVLARSASLLPSATWLSTASRLSIVVVYFCTTSSTGSWVVSAALRR